MSRAFLVEQKFPVKVPALLADPIDFRTGELLSLERGYDPTDAAVFTALRTVRASGSAVEGVGQKYHEQELIDPKLGPFMREETAFALRELTSRGQIELRGTDVLQGPDFAEVSIQYRNVARDRDRVAAARLSDIAGAR